jgi:formate hydrogenlyase subunit 4
VIAKVEARLPGRRGPRVCSRITTWPSWSAREALAPDRASWFFLAAPLAAVAAYLTIPLLIPVLTNYGLPLGYLGDILGGGFLLSLASFVIGRGPGSRQPVRAAGVGPGQDLLRRSPSRWCCSRSSRWRC